MAQKQINVYPKAVGIRPENFPTFDNDAEGLVRDQVVLVFYEGDDPGIFTNGDEYFEEMVEQARRAIVAYYEEEALEEA